MTTEVAIPLNIYVVSVGEVQVLTTWYGYLSGRSDVLTVTTLSLEEITSFPSPASMSKA